MVIKIMNTRDRVIDLEADLEYEDKVSLVFLVCDNPSRATDIICASKSASVLAALVDLGEGESGTKLEYIYEKLKEALDLMQNKAVLKKLELLLNCNSKLASWIKPMRKALYQVCENMTKEELSVFSNLVEVDLRKEGSHFKSYKAEIMELNILFWLKEGYIFDNDVGKLVMHLLSMKKVKEADMLKVVMRCYKLETDNDLCYLSGSEYHIHMAASTGNKYHMDENNMGICLIINQRDFDPVAMQRMQVEFGNKREGTNKDRDILKITFTSFGYKVIVEENLNHNDFKEVLKRILQNDVLPSHSSFILCILSHGVKGAFYCVDAVQVPIEAVEKCICSSPQLRGKPKIIIIQSCQGKDPQIARASDFNTVETDGDEACLRVPPRGDLVTFWATVPEHTSFRDIKKGSFFIQTLCRVLLKNGSKKHLLDLFTEVSLEVGNCHIVRKTSTTCEVCMPQKTDSLRKYLWFPYCSTGTAQAAVLLLGKEMFLDLFNEYVFKKSAERAFIEQKKSTVNS